MTISSTSNSAGAATLADEQLPEAGETAPLLGHDTPPPLQQKSSRPSPFTRPVSVVTILVYVVYFVALELSQSLPGNAFHQVVEENLCRDMHGRADAEFCGADNDVQSALAVLFAWHGTVQLLPGLLTAIPYALLADRYGQKPFIIINAFGVALAAAGDRFICYWPQTFSVYSLWAAPLLSFVGGGLQVCNALLFSNVTGLTTDASRCAQYSDNVFYSAMIALADRFNSPSVISVLVTLAYGPRLIATMASSKMIQLYGPWLLLWLSLGSAVLAFFSAFFLLEPTQRPRSSADAIASGSTAGPLADDDDQYFSKGGLKARILKSYQETMAGFSYLLKQCDLRVFKLAICLLVMTLAWQSNGLSSQIMRKRFGWTWANLSYLTALEVAFSIISSMVLFPAASYIMSIKFSMATERRDMILARLCGLLFLIGSILVISAFTSTIMIFGVVIWTLGSMYNLILRNLLVLAVGENSVVLFSCVNTVETIGNLAIAPIIAHLFKLGLHFGGVWVTMPVMIGSGFSVLALLILGLRGS
ncbi:ATP synthase F0 [Beauveria bassiana ARSEF 2860]|uniref:ATP synthase F0 n=1 Tax=Beauveria bassiana (strain ARSEF 2860) TaxID=655819 RepID=J5JPS6_BEAB2|nr:ATP synthase F0 [Beauveria bassiana ARSEF 2860]EJP64896.1 ATP synthase F0 [Beauveria bassiana ARSEF 2860]